MGNNTTEIMTCARCGGEVFARELEENSGGVCPRCLLNAVLGENHEMALQTTLVGKPPEGSGHKAGTEFGNYVILGVLGSGGMGVVYRARQKGLNRDVALKILPTGENAPEDLVERFFREARVSAAMKHPNIVPIHEISSHEGTCFFSMELVEGKTLSVAMREAQPDTSELIEILVKVARAVHYANECGLVHRDLKPDNIMIDKDGEPKVLDFGIAKSLGTQSKMTATGSAIGTPAYMSPEQVEGAKDIDARADVYSLGAVLYEILTGKLPHEGATAMEIFRKLGTEEILPPSKINGQIKRDLEVICLKALEKNREDRFDSAESFAADLERYLEGKPVKARPLPFSRRAGRFLRKRIARYIAVAVFLVMSVVIAFLVLFSIIPAVPVLSPVREQAKPDQPRMEREAVRKMVLVVLKRKMMSENRKGGAEPADDQVDPAEARELYRLMMKMQTLTMDPSADPAGYARFTGDWFELVAEETGVPFSSRQKVRLEEMLNHLADGISGIPSRSEYARLLKLLVVNKEFATDMAALLSEEQGIQFEKFGMFPGEDFTRYSRVSGDFTVECMERAIVEDWSRIMDLKEHQKERANQAAEIYVRELWQLREPYGIYARKDRADNAESVIGDLGYLIKSLQAQIKAFELLDGILEESQRLRLEKATNVRIYTPSTGESPDSAFRITGNSLLGPQGGLELLEPVPVLEMGGPSEDE